MARIEVCKVSELPEGQVKGAGEGENRILVANVAGEYFAMRAVCNHEGGPLDEGPIFENEITCPWHGSVWDVKTGKCTWFSESLKDEPTYKVSVEGESIFVEA
ncbi:MAG TPA: Rieske 2Fe-2S domain-containing protein [Candidatus Saccharimonadales bacterium]|nr:Rieske 2Fe-2S domain-containing protein [Candidatus Saccharimonadales bacterium]